MKYFKLNFKYIIAIFSFALLVFSCMKITPEKGPLVLRQSAAEAMALAKEITEKTSIKLAEGLKVSLWATDSLAPDPIAMSIDEQGRVFITRTNRQKNSEFDIRGHRNWMTESIGLQSVEDRRAFLHKIFSAENSKDNEWLKDLNGDGIHDWRDLAVEQEEVWRLEDTDNDGMADLATQVLKDFNDEITDVAGALLIRKNDAFIGLGPDLWRIEDTDGDGLYDKKTSISHGYAVHIGFSGHGMSGLIEGPDGKIYWAIGDIGANIVDLSGKKHFFPNQGVIVRCNPDGSDFEVFSHGHRNTHEFVFDEYGNIISSDNDGDHRGESERLVHIVEGSDSGWRANWQYGKYTDPKNNEYKVWMDEKLYVPRWDGQAAYIIPPIQNYHNGPTGMQYNPGTALGSVWKNKFFLVEFTGTPSRAHIWSFGLKPYGATFKLANEVDMVGGILATGIKFGPDGALYAADWINGWDTKNYGRVWKVDVDDKNNDFADIRKETKKLIQDDFSTLTLSQLYDNLLFEDQRVRQKAQFELVSRGDSAIAYFDKALAQTRNQLARIHAIWGIGQLMKTKPELGEKLVGRFNDLDKEIIAQSCKVLGDTYYQPAAEKMIKLLQNNYPRVRFYAAQALGRLKYAPANEALYQMLTDNADQDVYLRHGAVLALSRIGNEQMAANMSTNKNFSLRLGAVLVLRQMQSQMLSKFLNDESEYIVTEAARAINDDFSVGEALPALANVLDNKRFSSEPLMRRAINAALRVGSSDQLDRLIAYAERSDISDVLRAEALATIGTWADPSVMDRVDGRYRGEAKKDAEMVRSKIIPHLNAFLNSDNPVILKATTLVLTELNINGFNNSLAGIFENNKNPEIKASVLQALGKLKYAKMDNIIQEGMKDPNRDVRAAAIGMIDQLDLSTQVLQETTDQVLLKGSTREQQQLVIALGKLPVSKTEAVFSSLIEKLKNKNLPNAISLELSEAVNASSSANLKAKLAEAQAGQSLMDKYMGALIGGSGWEGRRIFNQNEAAQCVRCHVVEGQGGTVGPDLTHIGSTLKKEEILQALIEPSARLAPGYGSVNLTLKDGQEVFGILAEETDDELIIKTSDAEPTKIAKSRVSKRENYPSGMPLMADILSVREIRDVVEYVSSLK